MAAFRKALGSLLLATTMAWSPGRASADTTTPIAYGSGAAPAHSTVGHAQSEEAIRRAREALRRAQLADSQGDAREALALMREAYRLSLRPELFYNMAVLERELGRCPEALHDYRRYLDQAATGHFRAKALSAERQLELQCPPAPRVERPEPAFRLRQILGWSELTTGVLAEGAALAFTLAAKSAKDDVQRSVAAEEMGGPRWDRGRQDDQHRDLLLARAFAVSGGALVTGGALLLILNRSAASGSSERRARAGIWFSPHALMTSCSVAF